MLINYVNLISDLEIRSLEDCSETVLLFPSCSVVGVCSHSLCSTPIILTLLLYIPLLMFLTAEPLEESTRLNFISFSGLALPVIAVNF